MKFAVTMQRGRYSHRIDWSPVVVSEVAGLEDRCHVTLEGVTPDGDPILGICSDGPHYRDLAERIARKVAQRTHALSWCVVPRSSRHITFPVHQT